MKHVTIYTDGSCKGNPGPGGWAAILCCKGHERELLGSAPQTTNNRMELTAALQALRALKERCKVSLYTDSQYLRRAFVDGWIVAWQKRGWITASGNPVLNKDLWVALWNEVQRHNIYWFKVKAHADDKLNNRVDRLAVQACNRLLEKS